MPSEHPKIESALAKYGKEKFVADCLAILKKRPKHRVVLGLLGGASTGRYGFSCSAGKAYPRMAARVERDGSLVIRRHSGPYLCIAI